MISTRAPSPAQKARSFSTAAGSVPSGGVRMHQRLMNSSGKPESGPECSVPATGCAGTKCTSGGRCGAMSLTTAPLTEPTSEITAPGLRCGAISAATAPQAPTGMQRMTRSASAAASALLSTTASTMPSSLTRARDFADRAVVTISPASPCARAARAIEPPISPKPISAILRNGGVAFTSMACEIAQGLDHEAVGLLGADGHAQRVRQAVIGQRAQHQAAPGQEGVGIGRGLALPGGEMDQDKIPDARRHLEPEFCYFLGQVVAPFLVVRLRHLLMRGVLERRDRRKHGRRRDVEGAAYSIDRIDDIGRAEHPADPQACKALNLRKGVGHDGVVRGRHQFDAHLIVVR